MPVSVLLRRLEELLDIPDCDCKVPEVRFCLLLYKGGCAERQEKGRCDCVPYRAPCPHVFRADDRIYQVDPEDKDLGWVHLYLDDENGDDLIGLTDRFFREFCREASELYADPPLPPCPTFVQKTKARVAVMAERYQSWPMYAVRHPKDLRRGEIDEINIHLKTRCNGSPQETELAIYQAEYNEDEIEELPPLFMDEFDCRWLAKVKAVARRISKSRGKHESTVSRTKNAPPAPGSNPGRNRARNRKVPRNTGTDLHRRAV